MAKIAFLYPGQGAQKPGMGKDFYEDCPIAKEVFDQAEECLDFDVKKICFTDNEEIHQTEYTQAAMVTTCLAITEELKSRGINPDVTAGLSLGEYAAIVSAGGMDLKDAVRSVRQRGIFMSHAMPAGEGAMSAVLGMTGNEVWAITDRIDGVTVANFNCPGQIVITGKKDAVETAGELLKENGAKRVIPLQVSGAFHSPFMKEASDQLGKVLASVHFHSLEIPYVCNVSATWNTKTEDIKDLLVKQVYSPVLWEDSVKSMIDGEVDTFIEIGPGKTLSGFMRKIDKSVKMYHVSTKEDMENVVKELVC